VQECVRPEVPDSCQGRCTDKFPPDSCVGLSLEALFYWTLLNLEEKPKCTDALVDVFLGQVLLPKHTNARKWLSAALALSYWRRL